MSLAPREASRSRQLPQATRASFRTDPTGAIGNEIESYLPCEFFRNLILRFFFDNQLSIDKLAVQRVLVRKHIRMFEEDLAPHFELLVEPLHFLTRKALRFLLDGAPELKDLLLHLALDLFAFVLGDVLQEVHDLLPVWSTRTLMRLPLIRLIKHVIKHCVD